MSFFEALVRALIAICVLMLVYFGLFAWFLPSVGIMVPLVVQKIVMVMFVLVAILILVRLLWPLCAGSWTGFWGPPRP